MKEIEVGGHTVTVDDDLAPFLERVGLRILPRRGDPRPVMQMRALSSVVVRGRPGYVIDHINGNTLDNRRENLQVISPSHNGMKKRTTETPGVTYVRERGKYRARVGGQRTRAFSDLREARLAADAYRRSLGIKGMPLNFPEVGEYGADGTKRVS